MTSHGIDKPSDKPVDAPQHGARHHNHARLIRIIELLRTLDTPGGEFNLHSAAVFLQLALPGGTDKTQVEIGGIVSLSTGSVTKIYQLLGDGKGIKHGLRFIKVNAGDYYDNRRKQPVITKAGEVFLDRLLSI
jgi:hypothetical protein